MIPKAPPDRSGVGAAWAVRALLPETPLSVAQITDLVADAGIFADDAVMRELLERMCGRQEVQRWEITEGRHTVVRYSATPRLIAAQQQFFDAPQEST